MTRRYRTPDSKTPCEKCARKKKLRDEIVFMLHEPLVDVCYNRKKDTYARFKDETTRACKDFQAKEE